MDHFAPYRALSLRVGFRRGGDAAIEERPRRFPAFSYWTVRIRLLKKILGSLVMTTAAIDLAEFKSGWKILILGLVGMAISVNASLLYSFGALVIPLETAFGWSRG